MKPDDAARLAQRLASAFPARHVTVGAINLRAEKMLDWQLDIAERAIESLIDNGRTFPTIAEMREAYAGAGGRIADPTRDMSPPRRVGTLRAEGSMLAESDDVSKLLAQALARRGLTRRPSSGTVAVDDEQEGD